MITRLQQCDVSEVMAVYDLHCCSVYSLVFHLTKDTSVAEDLTEEVFMRFWTRRYYFKGRDPQSLQQWLLSTARQVAATHENARTGLAPGAPSAAPHSIPN